jgi:replicative DNA helicase
MIEKVPPQDIEAERQILGAILYEPDAICRASDIIKPADFYRTAHRQIYSAMLDLYQNGPAIDTVTIADRLKELGHEEEAGGAMYLLSLLDDCPTSANIKVHAGIVAEKSLQRQIMQWIGKKWESSDTADPGEFLAGIEADAVRLAEKIQGGKSPKAVDIICRISEYWINLKTGTAKYYDTSAALIEHIPGYFPGHMWVLGGYTSSGKSTFLAQEIVNASEAGARCLVFSTEDRAEEKMMQIQACMTGISKKWQLIGPSESQQSRIRTAQQRIVDAYQPIIYDDVYTVDEMRLKAKKHKMQDGINIVMLDYIQNVNEPGGIYERMSAAALKFYQMCKELEVTGIACSQVNNDAAKEENNNVIGLKGAGELAAAADIVLWLKRVKGLNRETWLDVEIRKNRAFGVTGIIPMEFINNYTAIVKRGEQENADNHRDRKVTVW